MQEIELKCKHCERYLGKAFGNIIATLKCSNSSCRAETQFKNITADVEKAVTFKFLDKPAEPKAKEIKE